MILFFFDQFWTQEMCKEIMLTTPDEFHHIPDHFKTQEMCEKAIKDGSSCLL